MGSVLFLCLGNICRSPLAEGAFRALLAERGLAEAIQVDSAGTGGWHAGEAPDPRSVRVAAEAGVDIAGQRARQLVAEDFARFAWIVAMDASNKTDALRRKDAVGSGRGGARVVAFSEFAREEREALARDEFVSDPCDVPDPYYGNLDDFRGVWRLLVSGMPALLAAVLAARGGDVTPRS